MQSKSDNSKTDQEYVFDADSTLTTELFSSRTADKQAAFFLPFLQPGMTLLDCGCGSGSITVDLAKIVEPGQVTGVDISETDIVRANKRAGEATVKNICFQAGNICQLEFPDSSFDALFSHNALEHIPELSRALEEMHRVLKPGGIIGLRDLDWSGTLFWPHNEHMENNVADGEAFQKSKGGHTRLSENLGDLLSESGFVEVKMSASFDLFNDPESRRLLAQGIIHQISDPRVIRYLTSDRSRKVADLEVQKDTLRTWQETPGAFYSSAEYEVIGRKA